ncbi:hypothetical protein FRC17_005709, partial [Serendipita sp. 399]
YVRPNGRYGAPVVDVTSTDLRCNYPYGWAYGVATVQAGSTVGFRLDHFIDEHGVLNVYMSRAPGKVADYDGSGGWFKIYEITANTRNGVWSFPTDNARNVTFPLPKSIPSAEYLLRIEHISLQKASTLYGARIYLACAQIAVIGGGTAVPATVLIPGVYKQNDPGILIDINQPAVRVIWIQKADSSRIVVSRLACRVSTARTGRYLVARPSLDFACGGELTVIDEWDRQSDSLSSKNRKSVRNSAFTTAIDLLWMAFRNDFRGVVGPSPEDITKFFDNILSGDEFLEISSADELVKWLQTSDPAIINEALDLMVMRGVVKRFVQFFRSENPNLQDKAEIVFGFLACGDTRHATIAYNSGILVDCIARLSSPDLSIRTKNAWILGNLAADETECAESLLSQGVLDIMVGQLASMTSSNEIETYIQYSNMLLWAINHFLKSAPELSSPLVIRIQELLCTIIAMNVEDCLLEECCYGLATIVQIESSGGSPFLDNKLSGRLIRLVQRGSNVSLQRASLQLVGALVAKSDQFTSLLLRNDILSTLNELIEHPLGEDVCWIISNIVTESVEHLNAIVYHPQILPTIIRLLKVDASGFDEDEFGGRTRECCAILANIVNKGQVDSIRHTVSLGGLSALCTALRFCAESDTLVMILDALWKLIFFGESDLIVMNDSLVNMYLKLFETSGGFEGLERLRNRKDRTVADAAQQMLQLIDDLIKSTSMDEDMEQHDEAQPPTDEQVGNGLGSNIGDKSHSEGVT